MIFTTHFLDEGEVLADHIVILSKGQIKCQGSGAELKNRFGGGYRVYLPKHARVAGFDAPKAFHQDMVVYRTPDSASAARLVARIEAAGCSGVHVSGPTVEDVFLRVARNDILEGTGPSETEAEDQPKEAAPIGTLSAGKPTSFLTQVRVLLMKRLRVLPRYWIGAFLVLALPIACMPCINVFMSLDFIRPDCGELLDPYTFEYIDRVSLYSAYFYGTGSPYGPPAANKTLYDVLLNYPIGHGLQYESYDSATGTARYVSRQMNASLVSEQWSLVNTYDDFKRTLTDRVAGQQYIQGGKCE